jgi:hypothetical protein
MVSVRHCLPNSKNELFCVDFGIVTIWDGTFWCRGLVVAKMRQPHVRPSLIVAVASVNLRSWVISGGGDQQPYSVAEDFQQNFVFEGMLLRAK